MLKTSAENFGAHFRKSFPLDKRISVCKALMDKYTDKIPIIVSKGKRDAPELKKNKFLVPCDIPLGKFLYELRKHMTVNNCEGIFLFINNTIPPINMNMGELYNKYKEDDGFLYITYSTESTFG